MNRCPNCGNKLNDIDVLCPKCGAFVEVVQIGSSTDAVRINSESISHSIKKEPRPELIVYNEDFPHDGAASPNTDIMPSDVAKEDLGSSAGDATPDNPLFNEANDSEVPASDSSHRNDDENAGKELPAFDESVYSESYLNAIRSMRLPEVEDLKDFDPETYIREFMQTKDTRDITPADSAPPAEHNAPAEPANEQSWLEIEEVSSEALVRQNADNTPETLGTYAEQEIPATHAEQESPDTYAEQESPDTHAEQESPDTYAEQELPDDDAPMPETTSMSRKKYRNEFLDNTADAHSSKVEKAPKKFPLLIALFWVVLTAVIFVGFVIFDHYVQDTYGSYSDMVESVTNGKIIVNTEDALIETTSVSITKSLTEDGSNAHLFLINADNSKSVTIWPLGMSFPLTSGQTEITVADDLIYKALGIVSSDTQCITNDVSLEFNTPRTSYTYPIDELTLDIVPTHYVRSAPTQSFLSTTNASIDIALAVGPHSSVTINGTDYTNDISANGMLSLNLSLLLGDNEFVIESYQPGKAAVKDTFSVTRQKTQTALIPDTNYLRIYADTFTCFGTTDPDAVVTAIIDEDQTFHAEVSNNGTYALSCAVSEYGLHDLHLTADSEWCAQTSADLLVEYIPDINIFIQDAKALSLDDAAVPETYMSISGILTSLNSATHTQEFSITDGADALPCYYHGTTLLEDGQDYMLYGMFDADANAFYAMYIQ